MRFVPLPGPQTQAYLSQADVTLYGGQAGGGKTGLLVGLAQEHEHSIIFRREKTQLDGVERFGKETYGTIGFNGTDLEWSFPDGRSLKLAGMREPDSWQDHAGRARDYMGFDEAGEFLREQVASIMAWNRGKPGQRCRILFGSNPPRTAEGVWLIEWFAPWLELNHPRRAKPGELRWAFLDPDRMTPEWVDGPEPQERDGELERPLSFTFIPAALGDNPYTDTPEYRAKLNALPEPLRSQLKKGLFALGAEDDQWQIIPTAWVKAAMDRWTPHPPDQVPMTALGVDVGKGGKNDPMVTAPRYDGWYDKLVAHEPHECVNGQKIAGTVISRRKNGCTIIMDVGGGWGAEAYGVLCKDNGFTVDECVPYMGIKPSMARSKENLFKFSNMRTQLLWQFREALDPEQYGQSPISLPPDNELLVDLTAPRYTVKTKAGSAQVIEAEAKDDVCERLGRSTDKGDAVVMAWFAGAKALKQANPPSSEQGSYRASQRRGSTQTNYGPRRPRGMTGRH